MPPRRVWDVEEIPAVPPWVGGAIIMGISTIIALAIIVMAGAI